MPGVTTGGNALPADGVARSLLIVARDQAELFRALLQEFGGSPQLCILQDARRADRRRHAQPVPIERRRGERRSAPHLEDDLCQRQYLLVRPAARCPKDWRLTPDR